MPSCSIVVALLILGCTSLCTALSPTFLWSNTQAIAASKVSYEVVQGTDLVLSSLLAASDKKSAATSHTDESSPRPDYLIAYFGRHADAAFFRQTGSPAGPLESVLESAKSWLLLLYSNYQGEDSAASIYQGLTQAGVAAQAVGCDDTSKLENTVDTVKSYIDEQGARVLLVCSNAADAAEEVAEVLSVNKALSDSGLNYMAVYATEAWPSQLQQRSLKEASSLTCGALCKSQVAWLQGILAAGVLLIALISGLSCTYLLDSPSKFEAPKDSSATAS